MKSCIQPDFIIAFGPIVHKIVSNASETNMYIYPRWMESMYSRSIDWICQSGLVNPTSTGTAALRTPEYVPTVEVPNLLAQHMSQMECLWTARGPGRHPPNSVTTKESLLRELRSIDIGGESDELIHSWFSICRSQSQAIEGAALHVHDLYLQLQRRPCACLQG